MFWSTKDQNADAIRMTRETYGTQQYWSAGGKHMYDHLPSSGGPRHDEKARAAKSDAWGVARGKRSSEGKASADAKKHKAAAEEAMMAERVRGDKAEAEQQGRNDDEDFHGARVPYA